MIKKIIVLVLIMMFGFFSQVSFAKEVDEDLKTKIVQFYKEAEDPESKGYKSWKEGLMKEYLLDLHKVKTSIEFLDQDEKEDQVGVSVLITVTGYGMAFNNQKKRVISVRALIIFVNKETRALIGAISVYRSSNKVLNGWNENEINI